MNPNSVALDKAVLVVTAKESDFIEATKRGGFEYAKAYDVEAAMSAVGTTSSYLPKSTGELKVAQVTEKFHK